jgi:hypothetical protein
MELVDKNNWWRRKKIIICCFVEDFLANMLNQDDLGKRREKGNLGKIKETGFGMNVIVERED